MPNIPGQTDSSTRYDQPAGQGPNDPGRPPDRPPASPRSLVPAWAAWLVLVGALIWNAFLFFQPASVPTIGVSYSTFLAQTRAGNVARVTIAGQDVSGAFKQPVDGATLGVSAAPSASDAVPDASDAAPSASPTPPTTFSQFTTVVPATGDDRLLPLLEDQNVAVTVKDTTGGSWLADLAISVVPTLLLIGGIVLVSRQAQRGQQSMFGFGASRARRYSSGRQDVTFADVAGEDEAKQELYEIVDFLRRPDQYRALGARLPRGVLLVGPPGTGKTLLARAIAGEANVPFFSLSASELVEMIVGVGASRVRDLFARAKAEAPAIIFMDEIDAVGRQRGGNVLGASEEREQTLNQLLVEMDGFDADTSVIVVAATNRPDVLDPALLRPGRFDRQVSVGLPDRTGRVAILKIHTRGLRLDPSVDLDVLARRTPGFSGADLANLANEAALATARRGGPKIGPADFDAALDKIVLGTRHAGLMNADERRLVAYHEGGHAVVARFTPGADPVNKITIIPHGRALGVTEQLPVDDRNGYTLDYLVGRITGMLGGRAAEILIFGQPATGAESDLRQATALARRMVSVWGMSPDVGLAVYGAEDDAYRAMPGSREYAEATAAAIDRAVRQILDTAYRQAYAILDHERPLLDALVEALLAHETLDDRQFEALVASHRAGPSLAVDAPTPVAVVTLPPAPTPNGHAG
jgi:cell division protease FtsH